jgi:hypothetical protein
MLVALLLCAWVPKQMCVRLTRGGRAGASWRRRRPPACPLQVLSTLPVSLQLELLEKMRDAQVAGAAHWHAARHAVAAARPFTWR